MPTIVNPYKPDNSIGEVIAKVAGELFGGDNVGNAVKREQYRALARSNVDTDALKAAVTGTGAIDWGAAGPAIIGSGYKPGDFNDLQLGRNAALYGARDDRTQAAQVGAGGPFSATAGAFDTSQATERRGQDVTSGDRRYGIDVADQTSRANNADDNRRALVASIFGPLSEGQVQPAVPGEIAGPFGLPAVPSMAGTPKRMSETEWKAAQSERLWQSGVLTDQQILDGQIGGGVEYGVSPIYGTDESGNAGIGTLGKDGSFKRLDTGGFKVSTGVDKVDVGTGTTLIDRKTGAPVSTIAKDSRGEARETAIGTTEGKTAAEGRATLRSKQDIADRNIALIDRLLDHKGLGIATGASSTWDPRNYLAGTDAADAQALFEQLSGGLFMEGFSNLKGGGQITETEGTKATAAMGNLNARQSEQQVRQALTTLRGVFQNSKARAIEMANPDGTMTDAPPTAGAPSAGGDDVQSTMNAARAAIAAGADRAKVEQRLREADIDPGGL